MGITRKPDIELRVPTELDLDVTSGTGITADVGHAVSDEISYSGAAVSSNLQDVADITDPSSWTDLIDLSGIPMVVCITVSSADRLLYISISNAEDAGEDIRAQILVDGVVVADITVTRDAGGTVENWVASMGSAAGGPDYAFMECRNSFKVRACCEGDGFSNAATTFILGAIRYHKLAS